MLLTKLMYSTDNRVVTGSSPVAHLAYSSAGRALLQ